MEEAAKAINYTTKAMIHNAEKKNPEEVTYRGEAAERSEKEKFSENKQGKHEPDIL